MDAPVEVRALGAVLALVRGGLPYGDAFRVVAREPGFGAYGAAAEKLLQGAPLVDCLPGVAPAFRSILRCGERTGRPTEAIEHVVDWSRMPGDRRLPLYYLACAIGTAPAPAVAEEGREVFEVHPDWKKFGFELAGGSSVAKAAAGKPAILPRPLDEILARAERSGILPDILLAAWEAALRDWVPYETACDRRLALQQVATSWRLLMTAGCPLGEALDVLRRAHSVPDLRTLRAEDFVASLEGAFTPSLRALLKQAYECGDIAGTLGRIAEDLGRGRLPA